MVNYKNGRIYKLVNNVDDKIYVGSTTMSLSKRKTDHRARLQKFPDRVLYKHLNSLGWDNVDIVLIESFPCNNKEELHKRERYWIEKLEPALNKAVPTQSFKEYYDKKKDDIIHKLCEKFSCECGGKYIHCHKLRHQRTKRHLDFVTNNI